VRSLQENGAELWEGDSGLQLKRSSNMDNFLIVMLVIFKEFKDLSLIKDLIL
jgi:hypothetical protein